MESILAEELGLLLSKIYMLNGIQTRIVLRARHGHGCVLFVAIWSSHGAWGRQGF